MNNNTQAKGVIAWFACNPVAANLLMVLILVAGAFAVYHARIESFPSIPPTSITVSVSYDSGSASSAEEGVALKIENALQGVEGIKSLSSTSTGDDVTVTITKLSNYTLDALYQDVKTKVDSISDLPSTAKKPVITRQLELEDVISINLYGDIDQGIIQNYTDDLRLKLLTSPKIQKVDYIGRRDEEIVIEVDEGK
ncbi:efflux RND transporter permease subunit, partial [Vibrio fortis]